MEKEVDPIPTDTGRDCVLSAGSLAILLPIVLANQKGNTKGGKDSKGGGKCKGGKGWFIKSLQDVFAHIYLKVLEGVNAEFSSASLGWLGRPMCCVTKGPNIDPGKVEASEPKRDELHKRKATFGEVMWMKPSKTFKRKIVQRICIDTCCDRSRFIAIFDEPNTQEDEEDSKSMCSSLSGNEELWRFGSDARKMKSMKEWNERYQREPKANQIDMRCEACTVGGISETTFGNVECFECGRKVKASFSKTSTKVLNCIIIDERIF